MSHRKGERSGENLVERSSPGFFVVIGADTQQTKKLMIPPAFVRNYHDVLANDVNLILPNCDVWKVGITKSDNTIWFDNNWDKFVRHYSILCGKFIVFKHKCFSNFKVRIFNLNGSEIQYPSKPPSDELSKSVEECSSDHEVVVKDEDDDDDDDDDEVVLILKKKYPCEKTTQIECSSSKQKRGRNDCYKTGVSPKSTRSKKGEDENAENSNGMCEVGFEADKKNDSAINASRMFKCQNPCFKVFVQEYHLSSGMMNIPCKFSRKYLGDVPNCIRFEVSDRRAWGIKIYKLGNGLYRFGSGWNAFAKENSLKKGDICMFELVKNNMFKVTVINVERVDFL